jgi:O-antigen ligase
VLTPLALLSPTPVAAATGRSVSDIGNTIRFRTDTWSRAIEIWRQRPALGFGPGQSSVQLAAASDVPKALRPAQPTSLQSAQGIWAAALVDAGIAGLACWIVLLAGAGFLVVRAVTRTASAATWAVAAASVAAIAGEQVTGDRLELRVWLLLGFGVAVSHTSREERAQEAAGGNQQAAQPADLEPDST